MNLKGWKGGVSRGWGCYGWRGGVSRGRGGVRRGCYGGLVGGVGVM